MKTYQFTCCERLDSPNFPLYDKEIIVIGGLLTPPTAAGNRDEALVMLNDWFITNKCRPFREVT